MTEHDDTLDSIRIQVESLGTADLRNWLKQRLSGRDPLVRDYQPDPPHVLVAELFPLLERNVREDVRLAVVHMLDDASIQNRGTESSSPEGGLIVNLLLLADRVLQSSIEASYAFDAILRLMRTPANSPSIRVAAAQALVALECGETPRFWIEFYHQVGSTAAPVVLEAIARKDFDALGPWLAEVLPDRHVESTLYSLIPFLKERHGGIGPIKQLLIDISGKLSPEMQRNVSGFIEDEQCTSFADELSRLLPPMLATATFALRAATDSRTDFDHSPFKEALTAVSSFLGRHTRRRLIPAGLAWRAWLSYVDLIDASLSVKGLANTGLADLLHSLTRVNATDAAAELLEHAVDRGTLSVGEIAEVAASIKLEVQPSRPHAPWREVFPPQFAQYLVQQLAQETAELDAVRALLASDEEFETDSVFEAV